MEDTKLIMVEGLPGSGKSTNSYYLYIQLERAGKSVKWVHEVARPHPTLFFNEAYLTFQEYDMFLRKYPKARKALNQTAVFRKNSVGVDLYELEWNYSDISGGNMLQELKKYDAGTFSIDRYQNAALDKWTFFAEKILQEKDVVYILDSSILQYQIFTFLLKNMTYEQVSSFVYKLIRIVKGLNPNLIYFYRENVADSIQFLKDARGIQCLEDIWERDKSEPYYKDKPEGVESFELFLNDYHNIADRLFHSMECRKSGIEITKQDWEQYRKTMYSFLEITYKPDGSAIPSSGIYRNTDLCMEIEIEGLFLKDPHGHGRKLIPKSDSEFYIECLPTILWFDQYGDVVMSGGQILERWTTSGTRFIKV